MPQELLENNGKEAIFRIVIEADVFERKLLQLYKRETTDKEKDASTALMSTRAILQKYEGLERITNKAIDELLPSYYNSAIKKLQLQPLSMPQMSIENAGVGRPCLILIRVLLEPAVTLNQFEGLEVTYTPTIVTDKDVETQLKALMDKHGFEEMNEEFVKTVGRHGSVEELVEDARTSLQELADNYTEEAKKNAVLDKLIEVNPVDLPPEAIDQQIDLEIEQTARQMGGKPQLENYMKYRNLSMDQMRAEMRPQALRQAMIALIVNNVVDRVGFEVTEEDIEKEITAQTGGQMNISLPGVTESADEMRRRIDNTPGMREQMERKIRVDKAMAYIVEKSVCRENEPHTILEQVPEYLR